MKRLTLLVAMMSATVMPVPLHASPEPPAAASALAQIPPVPEFQIPSSRAEWEERRLGIRARLLELLGRLPPRPRVPAVEILSREDCGDYVRESFRFDNGAGATVPGVILLPKNGAGPAPAILYCHWHGGEYTKGKIELFEANHTPEPPGPAFVRRGYVVLAIDAYCFGERNGVGGESGSAGELTASKLNLWVGRSLWGMILRDDLMALDYLATRPEVDRQRIGVTGMSMGATRSWWLMALDDRIKAGVAVACLTRYQNLITAGGLRHHGIYYYVPGVLNCFDTEAVVALSAPRPLLLMNGDRDEGSPVDGIRIIERKVRPIYQLYGVEARFRSEVYAEMGHEYRPAMWQNTLAWLEQHLALRP